jgi:DNA repair exonuclease SbcCD ATPase subunit
MDGNVSVLQTELAGVMKRAAELKVELDQAEGRLPKTGVPHYLLIENAAHELGQLLSRMVQQQMVNEVVAVHPSSSKCPICGTRCSLEVASRSVLSGDGRVDLQELVGHCPACRRDFFPLA